MPAANSPAPARPSDAATLRFKELARILASSLDRPTILPPLRLSNSASSARCSSATAAYHHTPPAAASAPPPMAPHAAARDAGSTTGRIPSADWLPGRGAALPGLAPVAGERLRAIDSSLASAAARSAAPAGAACRYARRWASATGKSPTVWAATAALNSQATRLGAALYASRYSEAASLPSPSRSARSACVARDPAFCLSIASTYSLAGPTFSCRAPGASRNFL